MRLTEAARRALPRRAGGRAAAWSGGRLPSLGQDHTAGHRGYVSSLPKEGVQWLYTKPFSAPPTYELARCLHSFAHIIERLNLGPGAQVLDVGCGPGWLSEWLARCGYQVTGIDVSKEMVAIARQRAEGITVGETGMSPAPVVEFHAMQVTELPWTERFDAAILYDALHHFHDERATLERIRRSLAPGGRIYIHEGVRPAPGSAGERELIEEMHRYGTLESPFDPDYLVDVVAGAGFVDIRRMIERDVLIDLDRPKDEVAALRAAMDGPTTNTLVGTAPIPSGVGVEGLKGRLDLVGPPRRTPDGSLEITVLAVNEGSVYWPVANRYPYPLGSVNLAPWIPGTGPGTRTEFARVPLPRFLPSGESAEVTIRLPVEKLGGAAEIRLDLVREGVAWFDELGSRGLRVPLR
jgi:SAM-dependent methyltransferase